MNVATGMRRAWRMDARQLDWSGVLQATPLAAALIAAAAVYLPALTSPFVSDDYTYLNAVKRLSFEHYLHAALIPGADDSILSFASYYWRPLYFLSFEPLVRLFGANVLWYHLVNLGIHLAGIILLWVLARRLTGRWEAAGIAAAIFAMHPAPVRAIAWIAAVDSAVLPLALGGWLAFAAAVGQRDSRARRRRVFLGLSVSLYALALGFHETAVVVLVAMALWYVLVVVRPRMLDARSYLPLLPFVALGVLYLLVRTRLFTLPVTGSDLFALNGDTPHHALGYLKLAFFPFSGTVDGWRSALQWAGAALILAAIPIALVARRWLLLALVIAFVISVLPPSTFILGVAPRYFYAPSALFALAVGTAALDVAGAIRRTLPRHAPVAAGMIVLVAGFAGVACIANRHVETWVDQDPDASQAWVDQLRATSPALPAGGTLYAANVPPVLAVLGGYALTPTVRYYYPQVTRVVQFDPAHLAQLHLRLDDRVFIYNSGE